MRFKRVLLKLSGEALEGKKGYGIDPIYLLELSKKIKEFKEEGIEIGIVLGGGNFFRGIKSQEINIERVQVDQMGMLATMINCIALQSSLEKMGVPCVLLSAQRIDGIAEKFSQRFTLKSFNKKKVVLFGFGTGNPFFSTDTAAALRAAEIKADIILKATNVDGIYNEDPKKNKNATKIEKMTFKQAIQEEYKVLDLTAFALCSENNIPILVFDINEENVFRKILNNEKVGTLVSK